jgi:hypothetical protein
MKRTFLAIAFVVGLVLGSAVPGSALIGDTAVTINCSDGTSVKLVVDADTLTGLIQGVQAMIDFPAGLTCTLIQVPVVVGIGGIALASPGQSPFIVGGGRWDVPCEVVVPPPPCPPNCCPPEGCPGVVEPPVVARARGASLALLSAAQPSDGTISVNVAVNFHQRDDGSFFGTLNETIPAKQSCGDVPVGETHFTSKPEASPTGCFGIDLRDPSRRTAHVVSRVTQTSGQHGFPDGSGGFLTENVDDVHFSFIDNGNPGHQAPGVDDMLQGPPAPNASTCTPDPINGATATGPAPAYHLKNGNITLHPKP